MARRKRRPTPGDTFSIPANSGFDITVSEDICEYVCSFVK